MLMAIFLGGIILLMLMIIKFKVNPFLALLFTSLVIGVMAGLPVQKILSSISSGFGGTLGGIGIVIALGIILGELLYETGGTEEIASLALRKIGVKNSPLAMALTGVIVAIPVYFDAAFVILVNLANQLSEKTGIPLVRFVTALGVGLIIGHCVIIPTPGPMAVAGAVSAPIGSFVLYSVIAAVPAALVGGVLYSKLTAQRFFPEQCGKEGNFDVTVDDGRSGERCPGSLAVGLILFPITLILIGTLAGALLEKGSTLAAVCAFVGDKNVALFLGVVAALIALRKYFKAPAEEMITAAAAQAGMVLLITGAGGSFGAIINATGIGDYIVATMQNFNVPLIILGFILSQILRAAQGSATVALVTTAAILSPSIAAVGASPVLVGLAICFGGVGLSLPNDSGFWVVNRFSGFTFPQTMKAWTLGGFIAGLTGLAVLLILSMFQDVLPGLM
ncbi:gluconate:H+ symporter, GntP family [Selenomonas ruminantium]|uniref:Gluconate:H+ symporter, GntP family n=1 Tax=Selenomonas ruminantium TaxID=971 RepID=A0A1M6XK36_SELRU|nr:gluconate:H+ symporter [Selenomonas ruminantium]SHL06327.1 gluconate:H+ symporter, GntP family [Selenomonas ruminantium]